MVLSPRVSNFQKVRVGVVFVTALILLAISTYQSHYIYYIRVIYNCNLCLYYGVDITFFILYAILVHSFLKYRLAGIPATSKLRKGAFVYSAIILHSSFTVIAHFLKFLSNSGKKNIKYIVHQ